MIVSRLAAATIAQNRSFYIPTRTLATRTSALFSPSRPSYGPGWLR